MSDLRKEIIEAGYKVMMVKNHPDQGPAHEKQDREETCQRLAVAREWLIQTCYSSHATEPRPSQPVPPREVYAQVVPQPIITREVIDHALDSIADLIFGPRPARTRRRPNPIRRSRRES